MKIPLKKTLLIKKNDPVQVFREKRNPIHLLAVELTNGDTLEGLERRHLSAQRTPFYTPVLRRLAFQKSYHIYVKQ